MKKTTIEILLQFRPGQYRIARVESIDLAFALCRHLGAISWQQVGYSHQLE